MQTVAVSGAFADRSKFSNMTVRSDAKGDAMLACSIVEIGERPSRYDG